MDVNKVDLIIQYALLVAGQEDDRFDRQLGPIHLIKYVYLADLAYAARNNGETFTGVEWQFYKFGPWSQTVHNRIEPALLSIGAEKKTFSSNYDDEDDWTRWAITDDDYYDDSLLTDIERQIPITVISTLRTSVHKYGKDTPSLLEHVYRTKPMLYAAPLELLDFSGTEEPKMVADEVPLRRVDLSVKKRKNFKKDIQALREKFETNFQAGISKKQLVNPVPTPRYDEIYENGLTWLDSLAGPKLPEGKSPVNFDPSVWKSSSRTGNDIS